MVSGGTLLEPWQSIQTEAVFGGTGENAGNATYVTETGHPPPTIYLHHGRESTVGSTKTPKKRNSASSALTKRKRLPPPAESVARLFAKTTHSAAPAVSEFPLTHLSTISVLSFEQ